MMYTDQITVSTPQGNLWADNACRFSAKPRREDRDL